MSIPRFPITPHLPASNLLDVADSWASEEDLKLITSSPNLLLEEKVDGANVGILWDGWGDLQVRNRDHHLKKGYVKKETPSKLQFRPLWNWVYDHRDAFRRLNDLFEGQTPCVYGEWLYAQHTIAYDRLPDLFVGLDLWMPEGYFLDPYRAREAFSEAEILSPPKLEGLFSDIPELANQPSQWASNQVREGVYVKCGDGVKLTYRAKFVRDTFQPRKDFTEAGLIRNSKEG